MTLARRQLLVAALLPALPARATPLSMAVAIQTFVAGAPLRDGRVTIDIAELVENGNTVPVGLSVQSPMTPDDHVLRLALFNERNPLPEVVVFHLSPRSGRARVDTRIRLATSQRLVAVAVMNDGTCWQHAVDVIVTLAACVEG
jgi:sulfur-oxidizing protein SoxY